MKTLRLSEEKAKELYITASPEFRAMLEETFGEPFFQSIDTAEEAQKYLELTNNCYLYINEKHLDRLKAFYHLSILCDAWNKQDGFVPDFSDREQEKWYPVFLHKNDGLSFSASYNSASYAGVDVGSQLCFKDNARADSFGKKYEDLFMQYLRG